MRAEPIRQTIRKRVSYTKSRRRKKKNLIQHWASSKESAQQNACRAVCFKTCAIRSFLTVQSRPPQNVYFVRAHRSENFLSVLWLGKFAVEDIIIDFVAIRC